MKTKNSKTVNSICGIAFLVCVFLAGHASAAERFRCRLVTSGQFEGKRERVQTNFILEVENLADTETMKVTVSEVVKTTVITTGDTTGKPQVESVPIPEKLHVEITRNEGMVTKIVFVDGKERVKAESFSDVVAGARGIEGSAAVAQLLRNIVFDNPEQDVQGTKVFNTDRGERDAKAFNSSELPPFFVAFEDPNDDRWEYIASSYREVESDVATFYFQCYGRLVRKDKPAEIFNEQFWERRVAALSGNPELFPTVPANYTRFELATDGSD